MGRSQQDFAAEHYASRARDYVTSAVHSSGDDLDQIEAALRGRNDAIVLDLGCGGGHVSYRAAPHVAEVIACDVTPSMLEAVAATAAERKLPNIAVQQAPAENLPFPNASFDFVLCRFTAHHWQDLDAGLREARRVLRPGGRAIVIDTIAPEDRVLDTISKRSRCCGTPRTSAITASRSGSRRCHARASPPRASLCGGCEWNFRSGPPAPRRRNPMPMRSAPCRPPPPPRCGTISRSRRTAASIWRRQRSRPGGDPTQQ